MHKYDYVTSTHGQSLGRDHECEYSHVWQIQGDGPQLTDIENHPKDSMQSGHTSKAKHSSLKRELPSVPDITRTDRIYELTLSGKGIPGGRVIAARNAQLDNTATGSSGRGPGNYSRRPGGPVYFELESQNQHHRGGNCSV